MARKVIDVGTLPNDGTGEKLRAALIKINEMTAELYALQGVPMSVVDSKVSAEAAVRAAAIQAESSARATALAAVTAIANQALSVAQSASGAPLDLSTIRDFADDAAAAAGGVLPGRLYRTGSVLHILPEGVIVDPGDGTTPIATRSISISPKNLTGVALGTKTFTITTTGPITKISWVLRKPDFTWETNEVSVPTSGVVTIDAYMFQQNQTVRVWDGDDYNMSDETTGISPAVSGGTSTPTPLPTGSGGNGTVGNVGFLGQGQSGSVFFWNTWTNSYKPGWKMMDALRIYTGLSQSESTEHWARSDQEADFSLASGTYTFNFGNPSTSDPMWLTAYGHDATDPSTWGNTDIMDGFLRYCATRKTDVAMDRPICLIRIHSEYDSRHGSQGAAVYDAATREFFKRYRAAIGRSVALSPIFLIDPAYDSGTNDATMKTIRDVHRSQALDTSLGVFIINGSSLDAVDRDSDASHWDDASAYRVADRAAVALAHWLSDNGYSRNDCSSFPRLGPTVTSIETVSGNASALDLVFTHDGGADDLIIPSSPDYDQHKVLDNNTRRNVVGMTKISGSRIRLALASPLTSSNVTYSFGERTPFSGPNSQIMDNWHLKSKPSFTAGSTIGDTRMLQNRYGGVVTLGGSAPATLPSGGGGGTPVGYSGPPTGWVKTFEDTFSRAPALGVEALDGNLWKRRGYSGSAHGGGGDGIAVTWDAGYGLESTGSSIKIKVRKETDNDGNIVYRCAAMQQGSSTEPGNWAYHPGYSDFYVKFRSRVSHLNAQGVAAYALMWPAPDGWTSEFDILEMPGAQKNRAMATAHWDHTGKYDLGANNDQTYKESSVDMTQWHIWECYRTIRTVNGVPAATFRVKIDGVDQGDPGGWTDNPYMCERMVFGAAGFCSQTWYNQGWFGGGPNPSDTSVTPTEFWMEMDYLEIWTPSTGTSGGTIPADSGSGGGAVTFSIGTLPTAQVGSRVYSIPVTGGSGTMSMTAVNGGGLPSPWAFSGARLEATVSGGLATFPALTLTAGQFYKVWDGNSYDTLTSENSKDSNIV